MKVQFNLMKTAPLILAVLLSMAASLAAHAHSRYILPTHTVLSGEGKAAVTFSASISNDIFHHDMPLGADGPTNNMPKPLQEIFKSLQTVVTQPNGQKEAMTWHAFARQSVSDLNLNAPGTYQISINQPKLLVTTFKKENGEPDRVFGSIPLPKNATDIVKREINAKTICYVTLNKPNKTALKPQGKGLELAGDSHPNDLFVNEKSSFRLLLNGKGVKNAALSLTKAGTKHRNQRNKITKETDKNGYFNITFDEPGFYLLEAEQHMKAAPGGAIDIRHHNLYITLEVFPE